jgi:metallo-beta-lactamase family protein
MVTGGRVVHHLAQRIGDGRNSVLIVGFQAPGTRGDQLRQGARTIKMLGRVHPVRADITTVALSAHADRSELLDWLGTATTPDRVLINHGELDASNALADAVGSRFDLPARVPQRGERVVVAAPDRTTVTPSR